VIRGTIRSPALHFLCLGAVLLVAARTLDRTWDRPAPLPADVSDEELLYQAAIDAGVDRTDPATIGRLARLGAFVGEDRDDEAALAAEARRLGLARSDVVVRRHLAHMMELAAGRLEPSDLPTDADLAPRTAELAIPPRVRFTQVYVSRARHGADADAAAATLLDALQNEGSGPDDAAGRGDAFATGGDVGPITETDLDRRFGPGFAAALAAAPEGAWAGPVRSTYGLHLVWVRERVPAETPELDAVRGRLVHRWIAERSAVRTQQRLAALRAR
jgi:parvulin-like peptidyl-prolyl isomerase